MDDTAKTLDMAVSNSIKAKELIDNMSEKINKELQKANDTGLFKNFFKDQW